MTENKNLQSSADAMESEEMEMELDDLDQVAGGSIGNVKKKNTSDITKESAIRF